MEEINTMVPRPRVVVKTEYYYSSGDDSDYEDDFNPVSESDSDSEVDSESEVSDSEDGTDYESET